MKPFTGRLVIAGLLAAAPSACNQPAGPSIETWIDADGLPSAVRPAADDSDAAGPTRLEAAINETVWLQLHIGAGRDLGVSVDPFVSPSGREVSNNVTIYRVHDVETGEWPAWYIKRVPPKIRRQRAADVLVPANAPRGGLPCRGPVDIWIDVQVPKGTPPGEYKSTVRITSAGVETSARELTLVVYPFVLPDQATPDVVADVDHQALFYHHVRYQGRPYSSGHIAREHPASPVLEQVLASTMRLLEAHRLTPQLPGLHPTLKTDADGGVQVDWDDYDRVAGPFIEGGAYMDRLPARWWRLPLDDSFPQPPAYGVTNSPTYARTLRGYLANAAEHFAARGWLERAFVAPPLGRIGDPAAIETARHYGYIIRAADSRLRIMLAHPWHDLATFGWHGFRHEDLSEHADLWNVPAQFFSTSRPGRGAATWLSAARPPFSGSTDVLAAHADARALPWQARKLDAAAVYVGTVNNWPAEAGASPEDCLRHDSSVLLYPGGPFGLSDPVPSVRLKLLHRGLQDAAYLTLMQSHGRSQQASAILNALIARCGSSAYGAHLLDGRTDGWLTDWTWWRLARRIMGDELLAAIQPDLATEAASAPALRWRRFMQAASSARLNVVGVRIDPTASSQAEGAAIAFALDLVNNQTEPLSGRLRFGELPMGWTPQPAEPDITASGGGVGRATLWARAASLAWDEAGVRSVPIELHLSDGRIISRSARLCHLTPQRVPIPPRVDGDLDDWSVSAGNDAGGFLSVIDVAAADDLARQPAALTTCFVTHDAKRIYFGLRCGTPSAGAATGGPGPRVEDLIPVGGDCVELLIDPGNTGSRSPCDLIRIAVGPFGMLAERGVRTDPPLCETSYFAADIQHAVRVRSDAWTAEISIPLEAFDPQYRSGTTWAINITRFDAATQEYSTWSGVTGNAYDPLSMGNMTLP